jgi:GNAT superfamily N-acetyltransferase
VRTASLEDNDELIALELETPLLIGDVEEFFNRSPDTFAYCAPHPGCRLVVAKLDGRTVGMLAGLVHSPLIQGKQHRLVYIHRGRVLPEFHHRGVGWALSAELFAWAAGAEHRSVLRHRARKRSIAFGGRAGGVGRSMSRSWVRRLDADGAAGEVLGERWMRRWR